VKLTFLGTRGWIEASNRRHRRHSALLVAYHGRRLMVDCGADWRGRLERVRPDAIALTHAHPDHAWGLAGGFDGAVLATEDTWADIADYPIADRRTLAPRTPTDLAGVTVEAFSVLHATRAPTVALKLTGDATVLYAPDVVDITDRAAALEGCELYVGDGVSLTRSTSAAPAARSWATPPSAPSSAGARRPASGAPASPTSAARSSRATSARSGPSSHAWAASAASRRPSPMTTWR